MVVEVEVVVVVEVEEEEMVVVEEWRRWRWWWWRSGGSRGGGGGDGGGGGGDGRRGGVKSSENQQKLVITQNVKGMVAMFTHIKGIILQNVPYHVTRLICLLVHFCSQMPKTVKLDGQPIGLELYTPWILVSCEDRLVLLLALATKNTLLTEKL